MEVPAAPQAEGEFDDKAAKEVAAETKEWHRKASARTAAADQTEHLFSFCELCDAQAELNSEAATSPHDKVPMLAVTSHAEAARASLLGLLNMVYLCRTLPWLWALVRVLPLRKPGKPRDSIEGHRPIGLLAAVVKVLDKLLFNRVWPHIKKAVSPWLMGGLLGADMCAWAAAEIFAICKQQLRSGATFAGFVDGENAYCRPPADFVMEALRLVDGLVESDLLIIYALLTSLWGAACIFAGLHGLWRMQCGLLQGGALSTALFVVLLLPPYSELRKTLVGLVLRRPSGESLWITILAYIDDLLIFATSARELQKAFNIIHKWARRPSTSGCA